MRIDTLLADAGYDSEATHANCRERLERRFGAATAATAYANPETEILLKVIAHNILLRTPKGST